MRRTLTICLVASFAGLIAGEVQAYEYPLRYMPAGDYRDLVVAGYKITGKTVLGNCSYTQVTSGSGRDPRPAYTPVPQTCAWDLYGNLLSVVPGGPVIPPRIGVRGTKTIYATHGANIYTGTDSTLATGGFVFTWGAHDDWLTSNAYMVLPPQPYTFTATLTSDGDIPLIVSAVKASSRLSGVKVKIDNNTCIGSIAVGSTCSITVTYNDSALTSPSGLAYDTLTVRLVSNAGVNNEFIQSYTDEVPIPADGGGD